MVKRIRPWSVPHSSCTAYTGLSVEDFKKKTKLTDEQLDTAVEEADLPELAACFDNIDLYIGKLQLTPGEQTHVRNQAFVNGTQAGMILALNYWRSRHLAEATFRTLLVITISLGKGEVAKNVCSHLSNKCKLHVCYKAWHKLCHFMLYAVFTRWCSTRVSEEHVRKKPSLSNQASGS